MRSASTAASSKDSVLARPERLASVSSPFRWLSPGGEGHRKPMPAICTIHEHDRDLPSPVLHLRGCPRELLSWVALPLPRPDQPSFPRYRGLRQWRLSQRSLTRAPPVAIARTEVGYPESQAPGHLLLQARGSKGWRSLSRRMPSHPFTCPPCEPACAMLAARRLAFARPPDRAASGGAPRRAPRSALPKVSSIVGRSPPWGIKDAVLLGEPFRAFLIQREGGRLSTGCSQPVDNSPAPFQPLLHGYALTDIPWQGLTSWSPAQTRSAFEIGRAHV